MSWRSLFLLPLLFLTTLATLPSGNAHRGVLSDEPKENKRSAKSTDPLFDTASYAGLRLRSIGPAIFSGRISTIAVNPRNRAHWIVGVACGGVWKTTNAGISWTPIFDEQPSYSIGYVALDPKDANTIWVGTGENNSQRSVGYGDGVYKSIDGGKSWKRVGLEKSEHIGKIVIDPRDSNVVYVAAQGPLWGPGGDRGLYKSTDGGKSWSQILNISENTGVTDLILDPRNPDILLAASYQRRRHVWTLINGGPEGGLHRSTDGGKTWTKITSGLPGVDIGRIGLAASASKPDVIYASIEAADGKGGVFRSTDNGLTWERRNPFDRGAMYFGQLVVDPTNHDRIIVMNVYLMASDDGGKTLKNLTQKWVHVDHHVFYIDPNNPDYHITGCDGGIYESFDRGVNWRHVPNLPLTQFYDVTCDESGPFYHVYGGTQDNNTLGGPAKSKSVNGITTGDWFVVHNGDGFHCKVDPKDPNTVYAEAQYGDLVRFDRKTGESVGIRPYPKTGEPPLRWNWDSPLVLSPHSRTRLYYAANRIFRSEDRGNSWVPISEDLSRQIDRDKLPIMGKMWGPDAVAKHQSTSLYGNIVALTESPKQENVLYAGTDDGLIHVTKDGKKWRKIEKFPGVPPQTYVSRLFASNHDAGRVYAAFDNHKNADFAPYLLCSADQGETWVSIAGDLPRNGPVLAFAEDHVDPNLYFVGTEFGIYFTPDRGKHWVRLKSGIPTISVRDLCIQRQENDLVVGTFGRGMYVLDDYSPLRKITSEILTKQAHLFAVKDPLMHIPTRQYGLRGKSFLGEQFYSADNPPYGATFTYHLSEGLKTKKQKRLDEEKKAKGDVGRYPTPDELRAEAEEEAPAVVLEVSDGSGVVRRLTASAAKGLHRVTWDLREPSATLVPPPTAEGDEDLFRTPESGPLVTPGKYRVKMYLRHEGKTVAVEAAEQEFEVKLHETTAPSPAARKELAEFQKKVSTLKRMVRGSLDAANAMQSKFADIKRAIDQTPKLGTKERDRVVAMEGRLRLILRELRGDVEMRRRQENTPQSIAEKVETIISEQYFSLSPPTQTHQRLHDEASTALAKELANLRVMRDKDVAEIEKALEDAGAPYTAGRLPAVKK